MLSNHCQCSLIQQSSSVLECDIPKWPKLQLDVTAFSHPITLRVCSCIISNYAIEDTWTTKLLQWPWKTDFFLWFVIADWKDVYTWLWPGWERNTISLQTFKFVPVLVLLCFPLLFYTTPFKNVSTIKLLRWGNIHL